MCRSQIRSSILPGRISGLRTGLVLQGLGCKNNNGRRAPKIKPPLGGAKDVRERERPANDLEFKCNHFIIKVCRNSGNKFQGFRPSSSGF